MTQSGQGEEPSARPAREGIVLPSDGGEPLLPGMTGGHASAYDGQQPPAAAPAGGQGWDTPWGPDQPQAQAPQPGQGWNAQPPHSGQPAPWGTPETPGATPSQPLPQEAPQAPAYGPADGYRTPAAGGYGSPAAEGYGSPAAGGYGSPSAGAQLPPAGAYGGHGAPSAPLPAVDEGATQYIPPVSAAPAAAPAPMAEGATQYLPPVAPADQGATQYIPPVRPGALPPEMPSESTHFLGRVPQGGPAAGAGQSPAAGPLPSAGHPDAEATQYIAPVPAQPAPYGTGPGGVQDRQPPSDFDNLFRSGPGESPAGSTQQLPRFMQSEAPRSGPVYTPPGAGGGRHGTYDDGDDGGRGGRSGSRVPLIAAVGIGIVVLGIGAGALLGGGGDKGDDKNQPVSATAPATEGSASPSADPAEQQAVALDKLLADSGSSRASVIKAVSDVRVCNNLGQAAKDLRAAATQRGELVTRLSGLTVDKLPDHAALTDALTKAWQASASADNHYAAWADQVAAGGKGCRKGQARTTPQTQAGNQASGVASTQKTKAAQLWNGIAKTYGLTERQPTQL